MPVEILIQRDMQHKDGESAIITLSKIEEEMTDTQKQLQASPAAEVPQLNALMDMMQKLVDATKTAVSESEHKYRK